MANPGWDQNNNPYGAQPPAGGQGGYSPPPSYPPPSYPPPSYPPPGGQGGYPGAPGGYPPPYPGGPQGYSAYPGGAGLPPEPVRPMTVTLAFYDWILMVVISAISVILVLTSSVWDQAVAAGAASSGSGSISIDVNSLVTTVKVITVVIFLVFAALYLFFAFKMNAGRNWARIVLTVVGALAVLSGFSATSTVTVNGQSYSANNQVFGWIGALLAVVAIVLMFLSQSNAYFTASKAHRQALR